MSVPAEPSVGHKAQKSCIRNVIRLSFAAGACAALLVLVVQVLFRKSESQFVALAAHMGTSASLATAVLAPRFLRLGERQLAVAFLLGAAGLGLTYFVFALLEAVKDSIARSPEPLSAFAGLPVFVAFSAPIAVPIALAFSWAAYRLHQTTRTTDDAHA